MGIKAKLTEEAKELIKIIKPFWNNFCDGSIKKEPSISVYKKNCLWWEKVSLFERCDLCYLNILRSYDFTSDSCDNSIEITIRWFDWNDELKYSCNYFPQLSNNKVSERVKLFLDTSIKSAEISHRRD